MLPTAADGVAWSVGRLVCLSFAIVSLAEMAEPTEMPFGMWTRVGPRNHVLQRDPDLPMQRDNFEGGTGGPL